MSDTPAGYFTIQRSELKIGSVVLFDCFVQVAKGGKIVHYLRAGTSYTPARDTKLQKLGISSLFVMNLHKSIYDNTVKTAAEPARNVQSAETNFGSTKLSVSTMVEMMGQVHIKGQKPEDSTIKVFGSVIQVDDRPVTVVSSAKQVSAPRHANQKSKVDADFLNVVIKATQRVFQERFKVPIQFRAPTKRTAAGKSNLPIDIASVIGLTSQTIRGTIGLCFPSSTYCYLLSQVMGIEVTESTSELSAGCGEFMYCLFETARPELIDLGYMVDQAVPTLIVGKALSLTNVIPDQGFSIVFESLGGLFQFEIGIKTGA